MKKGIGVTLALALAGAGLLACSDDSQVTQPTPQAPALSASANAPYQEPSDSIEVEVDLNPGTAGQTTLLVVNSKGDTRSIAGNGKVWITVPSSRPSVVYVMRSNDVAPLAWSLVSYEDIALRRLRIDEATTVQSLALMGPLTMPREFAGVDTMRQYALQGVPLAGADTALATALWNDAFASDSITALPHPVENYIEAVGTKIGVAGLNRTSPHAQSPSATLGTNQSTVPWVRIEQLNGARDAILQAHPSRGVTRLYVQQKTSRAMAVLTKAGSGIFKDKRGIAEAVFFPPNFSGSPAQWLINKTQVLPIGSQNPTLEIDISHNEAARYWGPDSVIEVKALVGTITPTDSSVSLYEGQDVQAEMGYVTLLEGARGFLENILPAQAPTGSTGDGQNACIRQTGVGIFRSKAVIGEAIGSAASGQTTGTYSADTAFAKVVIDAGATCADDIADMSLRTAVRKVKHKLVQFAGKSLARGVKNAGAVDFIGSMIKAAGGHPESSPQTVTWSVRQTWLTAIDLRNPDSTTVRTIIPTGVTSGAIPVARLSSYPVPLPTDAMIAYSTTGGMSLQANPTRFAAAGAGTGRAIISYASTPSGGRFADTTTITACAPSDFRLTPVGYAGTNSNKTTINVDVLRFRPEVKLDCDGGNWSGYPHAAVQAVNGSGDHGLRTTTATVVGMTSITSAWFVGNGGSVTFRATFRNPLSTPANATYPGGWRDIIQTVGKGKITNISPARQSLYFPEGGSVTGSWTGQYVDVNGFVRPFPICFKILNSITPAGSCPTSVTFTTQGTNRQITGFTTSDPMALSDVVFADVYMVPRQP